MLIKLLARMALSLVSFYALNCSAGDHNPQGKSKKYLIGEQIYTKGVLGSGQFIPATIHADIKVTGDQVICISCHRKSGMGTTEGQQVVPAIAGNILFNPLRLPTDKPPLPPVMRPAYTRESLKRSLIDGIDANGDTLDPFMPRYEMGDEDLDSLIVYLKSLSAETDPGVTDNDIHFSTIVIEGGNAERNMAMLDVFDAYFEQKNIETRNESTRAKNAPWHKEWMLKTYRKWKLHVWRLKGKTDTWQDQLEAYYKEQPVFAVLNGLVDQSFAPIHQFCEVNHIPCLFPTTLLPTIDETDFYTLYLNRGYLFEGEALAAYLDREYKDQKIVHLFDDNDKISSISAYGLRTNLQHRNYTNRSFACSSGGEMPDISDIKQFTAIVIHANKSCTDSLLDSLSKMDFNNKIFLSTRVYGSKIDGIKKPIKKSINFIHTQEMPSRLNRLLARSTGWFRYKRILNPEEMEVQANAYFALKVTGDALKHIRGFFFRDYFIEKIEHAIDDVPYTTVYPRLSLAPDQRFSSRGYYIAEIDEKRDRLSAITPWQAPD